MFVILCKSCTLNQQILKAELCIVIARIHMCFAILGIIIQLIICIVLQIGSIMREWQIHCLCCDRVCCIRKIHRVVLICKLIVLTLIIRCILFGHIRITEVLVHITGNDILRIFS